MTETAFRPDWASCPGDTIRDAAKARSISNHSLACAIGITENELHSILDGSSRITISVAQALERHLGGSIQFWMNRDNQYLMALERQGEQQRSWIAILPLPELKRFGWISNTNSWREDVKACMEYFRIRSVTEWMSHDFNRNYLAAYRKSPAFEPRVGATISWLRKGELEADSIQCATWNRERLISSIEELRKLTICKNQQEAVNSLRQICAAAGVAVVVVRPPSGCTASGATRFLNPNKAMLCLSYRHKSDDQFWFTFFHEIGHLVLHSESLRNGELPAIIEDVEVGGSATDQQEVEANEFAASVLIPPVYKRALLELPSDRLKIIRYAVQIGVSPGIVVGQLQYFGVLRRNQQNNLKKAFDWGNRTTL